MSVLFKSTFVTVFVATLISFGTANAILLKTETTSKLFENAKIVKSVVLVNDDKTEVSMKHVSHGLRKKAVFGLVPVSVYVLQMLATDPDKLVKNEKDFLTSIQNAGPIQMHFTLVRNLPGDKITSSLKDGLEANGLDPKTLSKELNSVLKEISNITELKEGESFALTCTWNGDNATVYLTDPTSKITSITGPKLFAEQLLSVWFGKAADSRLEDLKKTLIK